jgi:hypothetical protein
MLDTESALSRALARGMLTDLALLRTALQRAANEAGRCYLLVAVARPDEEHLAVIPFGIRADLADEWARRVGEEVAPQER